jgi:N-methylhydantoinase A
MSYSGQTHSIPVTLPVSGEISREAILRAFDVAYIGRYTQTLQGFKVALVNAKTSVAGKPPVADMGRFQKPRATKAPEPGSHAIFVDGGIRDAAVYERHALPVGFTLKGPALLLQADATTLVEPGHSATVHESGCIFIRSEV